MKNQVVKQIDGILLNSFEVVAGWIQFTISTESQNVYQQYSHIYDPLMKLKKWLEAICMGKKKCSFSFNPEGVIIKYVFEELKDDSSFKGRNSKLGTFKIVDDEKGYNEVYIDAIVDRYQLVSGFYMSFMSLAKKGYDPLEWDYHNINNQLEKLFNLNGNQLIDFLLQLNWKEFNMALYISDKIYEYTNKFSGCNIEILYKTFQKIHGKGIPILDDYNNWIEYAVLKENDDYKNWSAPKKMEHLKSCFTERISPYSGYPVQELKSEIIENCLILQGYKVWSIKN